MLSKETAIYQKILHSMLRWNTSSPKLDNIVRIVKVLDIEKGAIGMYNVYQEKLNDSEFSFKIKRIEDNFYEFILGIIATNIAYNKLRFNN